MKYIFIVQHMFNMCGKIGCVRYLGRLNDSTTAAYWCRYNGEDDLVKGKEGHQYIIKVITMGDYYDTLVVLMTAQQQHMEADTMARTISLKAKKATSL